MVTRALAWLARAGVRAKERRSDLVLAFPFQDSEDQRKLRELCARVLRDRYRARRRWHTSSRIYRMKTEPNQALEPTTTAVTPRAFARVAPSAAVAHL